MTIFQSVSIFFIDPYGYNEKKRKRENLMRMSALSSKSYKTLQLLVQHMQNTCVILKNCVWIYELLLLMVVRFHVF